MKAHTKTLLELDYKVQLSQVGACAACSAAEIHETKQYAQEAVARHRAISREVREAIAALIKRLGWYDDEVERQHQKVLRLKLGDTAEIPDEL